MAAFSPQRAGLLPPIEDALHAGTSQQLLALLRLAEFEQTIVAIVMVAFERFKEIGHELGKPAVESMLGTVARRLSGIIGNRTQVGRYGMERFVVAAGGFSQPVAAHRLACEIEELVTAPVCIRGLDLLLTPILGVSFFPFDGSEPAGLLSRAEELIAVRQPPLPGKRRVRQEQRRG